MSLCVPSASCKRQTERPLLTQQPLMLLSSQLLVVLVLLQKWCGYRLSGKVIHVIGTDLSQWIHACIPVIREGKEKSLSLGLAVRKTQQLSRLISHLMPLLSPFIRRHNVHRLRSSASHMFSQCHHHTHSESLICRYGEGETRLWPHVILTPLAWHVLLSSGR